MSMEMAPRARARHRVLDHTCLEVRTAVSETCCNRLPAVYSAVRPEVVHASHVHLLPPHTLTQTCTISYLCSIAFGGGKPSWDHHIKALRIGGFVCRFALGLSVK